MLTMEHFTPAERAELARRAVRRIPGLALTLIRSLLWMDHYGRGGDQEKLMSRVLRHYLEHPEDEYTQEIDPFDGGVIRPNGKDCVNMMVFFLISCRRLGITGGCYSSEQPLM